jgi:hypothetical protein
MEHSEHLVLDLLTADRRKSLFVGDLVTASRRRGAGSATEIEGALSHLEQVGRVLIRNHSSGDPHLADADLRVVGLVDETGSLDGKAQAIASIQATWTEWLAEFVSNHRCG